MVNEISRRLAVVFAGQGSQSIGLMNGFGDMPVIRLTFDEASESLGLDVWKLMVEGPADAQNQTVNTQPLMLTAGVATWRAWQEKGGSAPTYFAGHSLGEYTALVASNALSFATALPLVRFRAQAMQDAVPEGVGGIAAILGLDIPQVTAVCADAAEGEVLEAVNLNSPGQIVIAGHRSAVERGMALAKARGAKRALMLPMSAPSHCALMKPAAEKLADYLKNVSISMPDAPVIHNMSVAASVTVEEIKTALIEQLFRPVRWIETIQLLAGREIASVVECVPGKILTGLNKRIDANLSCHAVTDCATLDAAIAATR